MIKVDSAADVQPRNARTFPHVGLKLHRRRHIPASPSFHGHRTARLLHRGGAEPPDSHV